MKKEIEETNEDKIIREAVLRLELKKIKGLMRDKVWMKEFHEIYLKIKKNQNEIK